jgi:hypothetical protein
VSKRILVELNLPNWLKLGFQFVAGIPALLVGFVLVRIGFAGATNEHLEMKAWIAAALTFEGLTALFVARNLLTRRGVWWRSLEPEGSIVYIFGN